MRNKRHFSIVNVRRQNPEKKGYLLAKVTQAVVLVIFILVAISFFRGLNRIFSSRERISSAQQKLEEVKKTRDEVKTELEKVQSDFYKSKIAYDKLGLVKEGEVVIVLPEESLLRRLSPRIDEIEETEVPKQNWQKWKDLFLN